LLTFQVVKISFKIETIKMNYTEIQNLRDNRTRLIPGNLFLSGIAAAGIAVITCRSEG